jgi:hypothetical protein
MIGAAEHAALGMNRGLAPADATEDRVADGQVS